MSIFDEKKDGEILTALADHLLDRFHTETIPLLKAMLAEERAELIAELRGTTVNSTVTFGEKPNA